MHQITNQISFYSNGLDIIYQLGYCNTK